MFNDKVLGVGVVINKVIDIVLKRTFIAIPFEPYNEWFQIVKDMQTLDWGAAMKWVEPEQWHITLAFIGDTSTENEAEIKQVLTQLITGFEPIDLIISGFGRFTDKGMAKVLWIGIEPSQQLEAIRNKLAEELSQMGLVLEARPFVPHVTLARVRNIIYPKSFKAAFNQIGFSNKVNWSLTKVVYYESVLSREGAIYNALWSRSLASGH